MNILLSEVETRVLGSLIEKDITTPDYYPLSLNALVNACNQKNNRDPVMHLDEDAVRQALDVLHDQRLAGPVSSADSRVPKYEHRLQEVFNFTRGETALVCVLLLRGPQTPGELRGRSERMHRFEDLTEVQSTLQRLSDASRLWSKCWLANPAPRRLAPCICWRGIGKSRRARGARRRRGLPRLRTGSSPAPEGERIARLENEVADLGKEVAELKQQLGSFRKQFE